MDDIPITMQNLSDEEIDALNERILALRNDQIAALFPITGIVFTDPDALAEIAEKIHLEDKYAANLTTLIDEADTLENLLWWIEFFEGYNKRSKK